MIQLFLASIPWIALPKRGRVVFVLVVKIIVLVVIRDDP
jgi:hypothetical protein